jgi:hypothetical protein
MPYFEQAIEIQAPGTECSLLSRIPNGVRLEP